MQRQMLKSKIHRAVVYALEGERGSGTVQINGAAALLAAPAGSAEVLS